VFANVPQLGHEPTILGPGVRAEGIVQNAAVGDVEYRPMKWASGVFSRQKMCGWVIVSRSSVVLSGDNLFFLAQKLMKKWSIADF
jgi:hypothetical protein